MRCLTLRDLPQRPDDDRELIAPGYRTDLRLRNALVLKRLKQDAQGRWSLEYNYRGKIWLGFDLKR